jgi:hypothetical protein
MNHPIQEGVLEPRVSLADMMVLLIPKLAHIIRDAIKNDKHNVIPIWGEMGLGKTSLALWIMYDIYEKWDLVFKNLAFTFWEFQALIRDAVEYDYRIAMILWDDIAVYFHRASIVYTNPIIKTFFARYNFVRPYVANVLTTSPNIEFIPRQLLDFATADIFVKARGIGDFDRSKLQRNYKGKSLTRRKNYDGVDVEWEPLPPEVELRYKTLRHEHAVAAFNNEDDIFIHGTLDRFTG